MPYPYLQTLYIRLAFLFLLLSGTTALADQPFQRISGPYSYDNLSIYLLHGPSQPGAVPMTLEEAIAQHLVRVIETSNVNQLAVKNLSDKEVFIQSGDIVKGGKQDRVLALSMILKPRSGTVPIGSFCVEAARWSARGEEAHGVFSSSTQAAPSREMKLAMKTAALDKPDEAIPARGTTSSLTLNNTYSAQQKVWEKVAETQDKLSRNVGVKVKAARSPSSLQLALENETLKQNKAAYLTALQNITASHDDVIGYAFAINGTFNSADIYPSNGLFKKMWPKQLRASITEAIAEKQKDKQFETPAAAKIEALLAQKKQTKVKKTEAKLGVELEESDAGETLFFASRHKDGRAIHYNYTAK